MSSTELANPTLSGAEPVAAGAMACTHCGLPVPAGLVDEAARVQFCCEGCRTAFAILHEHGLERYYGFAERRGAPARASGKSFEEFDHDTFHARYVTRGGDGCAETDFYLEGVHCASCVWLVERVPLALDGLGRAELDVTRSLVHVSWDPARIPLSAIARFLDQLGYRPHPYRGRRADALRRDEDRAMLIRIAVAGAIAANVMLAALALYSGAFGHMEPVFERYFRWVCLVLTTPAVFGPGRVFFRGAWAALRMRTGHMDLPIALALAAGYARGAWNTIAGAGPIYFDGVAALIFLLLVGRFLQQRAQRSALDATELLASLSPASARVVDASGTREVPIEALLPGHVLEVRAGETLAADGTVLDGRSELDLALLTGESRPVGVGPGDAVYAGAVNLAAPLRVRADQAGDASRLGRLLREVESGASRRAPVVKLADRLSGAFVLVVIALAAVTWIAWLASGADRALDHAIALLIVTCPCALALATPLAVSVAIGRAARVGILVKGGDALEALARPGLLLLDKTGTLTEGRVTLTAWESPDGGAGPEDVKPLVLALERHARHPVAAAFAAAWPGVAVPAAGSLVHTLGGGIEGIVLGRRVAVGSPTFVRGRLVPAAGATGGCEVAADGGVIETPVWVAVDGRFAARARFGDRVRPDAAVALATLRGQGWTPRMLSGDDPAVAAAVGAGLGFRPDEIQGGATPEAKLAIVEAEAARGPVTMVGDGVNDAAAIARATVGIGVRGGAEACLAAADVFLARPGVAPLVELTRGARRTLGVIRRNIGFSIVYNVAGAALAMMGLVHPLLAALLMPASSFTVVLASRLGRTFEEPRP